MALFGWSPSLFSLLQSLEHSSIPKPSISKTLIPVPTTTNRKIHPVSISSASPGLRYPCLRCCSTNDESSSTRIFIKGLPQSTCEGSLKKAFSQFGEVSKVKIMRNKISSQPLGFAFVWFTTEESAQLAVKVMDGKVCVCQNCKAWTFQKACEGSTIQVLIENDEKHKISSQPLGFV